MNQEPLSARHQDFRGTGGRPRGSRLPGCTGFPVKISQYLRRLDLSPCLASLYYGIVLVTYLNQLRQEGLSTDEASIKGLRLKLRPVLMTALAAALGVIPLLFSAGIGSEVQRPLATAVVGGLVTSPTLTLLGHSGAV